MGLARCGKFSFKQMKPEHVRRYVRAAGRVEALAAREVEASATHKEAMSD
jgi:hypothetical protein